jgi:4-hydroxyphenylpyruvate dioxygenase
MKTSIATVSISGDFTEKLAAIAAAGFDSIEIFEAKHMIFSTLTNSKCSGSAAR